MILCKYGIEYVEEEGSNKQIPTVNRTQTTSVLSDPNYRKALENAASEQKATGKSSCLCDCIWNRYTFIFI